MTAASNKFLRIYYARVKEFMDSLETETICEDSITQLDFSGESQTVSAVASIISTISVKDNTAFTCEQDSAIPEGNMSGSQDFGLYG